MLRKVTLIVLLITFLLAALPVGAQGFAETFLSQDGRFSFGYPTGWFVQEELNTYTVSTVQKTFDIDSSPLQPGEAGFGMTLLERDGSLYSEIWAGTTPLDKLEILLATTVDQMPENTLSFSSPVELFIGDYLAARTDSSFNNNQFVVFMIEVDKNTYVLALGITSSGELDRLEPKFISIAATLRFSKTPQAQPADPVSLNSLAVISATNADRLEQLSVIRGHSGVVLAVALSPDGRLLVSGGYDDGSVQVWDVTTGERIATPEGHSGAIQQVLFNPDGRSFATMGFTDGTLRIWDAQTFEQIDMQRSAGGMWYMAYNAVGTALAYSAFERNQSDNSLISSTVSLWDFASGENRVVAEMPAGRFANSVNFSPDGSRLIYSASDDVSNDEALGWVYDIASGEVTFRGTRSGSPIDAFFSAGGQPLITVRPSDNELGLILWNLETEESVGSYEGDAPFQTLVNQDYTLVGSAGLDETMRLWTAEDGLLLARLDHLDLVYGVAFSRDGRLIATSTITGNVYLWGLQADQ
jgi:WD40 repeat protein